MYRHSDYTVIMWRHVQRGHGRQIVEEALLELEDPTFDGAGGDDALGRTPVATRYNARLIQVGPRDHHLLQVLYTCTHRHAHNKLVRMDSIRCRVCN